MRKRLPLSVAMIFGGLMPVAVSAQTNPIFVLKTINYPGVGNSTTPFGINDRGDIVGDYVDSGNVRRGFVLHANGSFTQIVAPGDTGNFTRARGVNNRETIVGDFYTPSTNAFHGFILRNGGYTQYDIGVGFSTDIFGINDGGNFVGVFGNFAHPNTAFVNIGGTVTPIIIPGAYDSQAVGINNSNEIVGSYRDTGFIEHGFLRRPNGALVYPIDFPGSSTTALNGINNLGWIVGRYNDTGHEHGFFRKNATSHTPFNFPGAAGTSFNGIDDFGFIAGRYTDNTNTRHGFVAWVFAFSNW